MDIKRTAIIGAVALAAAGGGGAAVAAMSSDDAKEAEDSIIERAAERLDVQPNELRGALGEAEDAQLDEAVRNGDLTRRQADRIKRERRRSGRVLGHPAGPPHGFAPGPHGGRRHRGGPLAGVARALGISRASLFSQLRAGRSLADIARAEGKSRSEVEAAVKARATRRLDEHFDRLWERGLPRGRRGTGPGPGGPPPGFGPGGPPPR